MARQEIVDVWRDNLDAELNVIRDLVDEYPYVGMVRPSRPLTRSPALTWDLKGHRVPWRGGASDWDVPRTVGLPLPDAQV